MFERTSIGGLLLGDVAGWAFDIQDGIIVGRFREDPGILLIATTPANKLPQPVTHEACLARAADLVKMVNPKPAHWNTLQSVTGPYGSANFERGSDRVFCWYCCRAPGVIVGTYSCPVHVCRTYANRGLRANCYTIITSAVFDRRSWGADDTMTQVLIALLGADDPEDQGMQVQPDANAGEETRPH